MKVRIEEIECVQDKQDNSLETPRIVWYCIKHQSIYYQEYLICYLCIVPICFDIFSFLSLLSVCNSLGGDRSYGDQVGFVHVLEDLRSNDVLCVCGIRRKTNHRLQNSHHSTLTKTRHLNTQ